MAKITGVGGIFITARDMPALAAWYRDTLGIPLDPQWNGAMFTPSEGPPMLVFSLMPASSDYLKPSTAPYMLNFGVDDLDGFLAQLKAKGVEPTGRDDSDPNGSFAWVVDPEGNKIELWQAKA